MSDYYTNVPVRDLGGFDIPALFLGDHGFNEKFGSSLTDSEIRSRMEYVVARSNLGLGAGDERLLRLAREAEQAASNSTSVMFHTDVPLENGGGRLRYGACGSTLRASLERRGFDIERDPVLSYLLEFDTRSALSHDQFADIRVDRRALDLLAEELRTYRPSAVSVGGDWLDMLLLSGLDELAWEGLAAVDDLTAELGIAFVVTIYVGPLVSFVLPERAVAALVPVNKHGVAMVPDRDTALGWMHATGRPFIGMHLMSGAPDAVTALRGAGVVEGDLVVGAIVGASSPDNIDGLLAAARETWG